jgi:hypothetical protein
VPPDAAPLHLEVTPPDWPSDAQLSVVAAFLLEVARRELGQRAQRPAASDERAGSSPTAKVPRG